MRNSKFWTEEEHWYDLIGHNAVRKFSVPVIETGKVKTGCQMSYQGEKLKTIIRNRISCLFSDLSLM